MAARGNQCDFPKNLHIFGIFRTLCFVIGLWRSEGVCDDDDNGNCQNDSQIILVQKVLSVMDDELFLAFYHQFFYIIEKTLK